MQVFFYALSGPALWNLNSLDSFKLCSSEAVLMELLINNSLETHTKLSKVTAFIFSLCQCKNALSFQVMDEI